MATKKTAITNVVVSRKPVPVRESGKEARRQLLLDSAEELIRQSGDTDFTMNALAAKAGLSPATPFNLCGSKGELLYLLLNRSLDRIMANRIPEDADPFERLQAAARFAGDSLVSDSIVNRPLYRYLFFTTEPLFRSAFMNRSFDFWHSAVSGLAEANFLSDDIDADNLTRDLVIHAAGIVVLWSHGDLDNEAFRAQFLYGVVLKLLIFADSDRRIALQRVLDEMRKQLPKRLTRCA